MALATRVVPMKAWAPVPCREAFQDDAGKGRKRACTCTAPRSPLRSVCPLLGMTDCHARPSAHAALLNHERLRACRSGLGPAPDSVHRVLVLDRRPQADREDAAAGEV